MGAVLPGIEANTGNPAGQQSRILTGRQVWPVMKTTGKQVRTGSHGPVRDPGSKRLASLSGQFKLDRMPRFLLHYNDAFFDAVPGEYITDPQGHQITAA